MADVSLPLADPFAPQILLAEPDFIIAYKPPRMHSAPLAASGEAVFFDWCVRLFPEIAGLPGRKSGEGGLLHRLDYETHGLMLIARTAPGAEYLFAAQREKKIAKGYRALSIPSAASQSPAADETKLPGFPPVNFPRDIKAAGTERGLEENEPLRIASAFRPYGPGRKAVRPATGRTPENGGAGELYTTEIIEAQPFAQNILALNIRIRKGFRHQIRCHLAWMGLPLLNDRLYGGHAFGKGFLGLRASSLSFAAPGSGEEMAYSIPPLEPDCL